jgi:FlgD Ig-like domain
MLKEKKCYRVFVSCLFLILLLTTQQPILGTPEIDRDSVLLLGTVVGAAGAPASGAGVFSNGTMGQSTPIGIASGPDMVLYAGFWKAFQPLSGTETPGPEPMITALLDNYPNPFNPKTRIDFSLAGKGSAELAIFNARGELVRNLLDEALPAGKHTVWWDGTHNTGRAVAAGVYFYRLRTEDYQSVKKMLLLK